MTAWQQGLTLFFSLLVEALPFLLLGVLFSSALLLWVDPEKLVRRLPRHPLAGAVAGAVLGCLLPVCECGNVPVARRLLTQGLPTSVAVG
ncbi:MAG: permease, partial [Gloeomargarita sp. GXS_bins_116]